MNNTYLWVLVGVVFAALTYSGCDTNKDMTLSLIVYDSKTDSYVIDEVDLTTIDDLGKLKGEATELLGGADLTLDYNENILKWNDHSRSVAFSSIKKDGVLYPQDYDSLAMASIYYNIEQSMLFFEEIGLPRGSLGKLPTYYWSRFEIFEAGAEEPYDLVDNALFMFVNEDLKAFFVMPFDEFEWIPMPLNTGIMTHEYTHAVFDHLIWDINRPLIPLLQPSAANFLYGLNEGIADFMAYARTSDPDFIAHSIPKGIYISDCNGTSLEVARDLSHPFDYSQFVDNAARNIAVNYCPYQLGSFWSSMLYEMAAALDGDKTGVPSKESRYQVAGWIFEAMGDLGEHIETDFEIWDMLNLFVGRINNENFKIDACDIIQDRYEMHFDKIEGC